MKGFENNAYADVMEHKWYPVNHVRQSLRITIAKKCTKSIPN